MIFFDLYKKFEKRHIKIEKMKKNRNYFAKNAFKNEKILKKYNFVLAKSFNRM